LRPFIMPKWWRTAPAKFGTLVLALAVTPNG
jgi:hypothetical protein